ncbi:hypothetical protein H6P81_013898 [Aristolochia fimbriata]|uniref:Uncharacterized protein n=1 Tax=Aristolochia fimbriata TaxID=158543 RepID=A0AAV7EFZ2_ARIFI|nr:hypothetical protein H6P81_013898 [Aristolochia fimbriata]
MAAPSVTLVGGLRAFHHTVVVEGETIQTLALYMEGDASHMTYCPSGESVFGGHAEKPTSLVDSSRSCEFLSRRLATSDRVFFLPCLDTPEREDEAAKPETFALQRASWLVNKPPLPHLFEDGVVERTLYTPDTALDKPIPFIFEWTTLLMGRCGSLLHNAGIYYGIWGSLFQHTAVASYMATGVRFCFGGPALACLYKGLGHAAAGWPSMARWPYLYTWLAVYFHTPRGGFLK